MSNLEDSSPNEAFLEPSSRSHHYAFAHYLLRNIAYDRPENFLATLEGPDANYLLCGPWDKLGRESFPGEAISRVGLQYLKTFKETGLKIAIVQLPEPKYELEALYVALVLMPAKRTWFVFRRSASFRYMTLERTQNGMFALCEWTKDDVHGNYGLAFANPTPETFLNAIQQVLTNETRPSMSAKFKLGDWQ